MRFLYLLFLLTLSGEEAEVDNSFQESGQESGSTVDSFFKTSNSFFDEESATTVFRDRPKELDGPELGQFKEVARKTQLQKMEEERRKTEQKESEKEASQKTLRTRAEILAAFGDPSKVGKQLSLEHLPKEAPPALRAMVAALNIGDQELANEYAQAYADHFETLQGYLKTITQLTELNLKARRGEINVEQFDKLSRPLIDHLKSPAVQKVQISGEEINNVLSGDQSKLETIRDELENYTNKLGVRVALKAGDLKVIEEVARQVVVENGFNDRFFDVLILVNNTAQEHIMRAASLVRSLLFSEYSNFAQPKIIFAYPLGSIERTMLAGTLETNVPIIYNGQIGKVFGVTQSVEVVLVGKETGQALRITEANPEFLRQIIKFSLQMG
ncbi:MAG: hypothetical protein NZO16_00235 [Deltaproteobacteria bacterium]|nr:hypothetical protein [Deltaproteobacteria bacterium]